MVLADGTLLATPVLSVAVDSSTERGLLGVVAHPQFASNGFIYIYYTTPQGGTHYRISRFTVSGNTASGEVVLVDLPALTAGIHNGGAMRFGNDGKLYVAVGDNQVAANAQNLNSPLGKLLRFNDDGSIPSDNPFCTTPGNLACAGLGPWSAQPVHLCRAARHRPHPRQRCRSRLVGRDQCRVPRRQLWMAGDRRPHQRHRSHASRFHLPARSQFASTSRQRTGRLHRRGVHHRRRFLSEQRPLPGTLARRLLLHRLHRQLRRLRRPEQRQCGLFVRQLDRAAGRHAGHQWRGIAGAASRVITRFTAP